MLFCTVGFVLLPTSYVWANPAGEAVVGGAATFQRDGNKLTVNQTTDRLAVNWQSFNIAAGERTHFNMPSSTSAALNRVIGGNPSSIYGSLSANGILYLINPSGILVGPGGTVNAAAFMASTLDVSTEQFMNAKNGAAMSFVGTSGESIINQGNITAEKGDVFLVAQKVENRGTINAANGTVGMVGSGQSTDVMVHEVGGKGFAIRVAQLQGEAATGSNRDLPDGEELLNEGSINAAQAELNASGNVYALAIRNSGTIRAKAVVANADGTVRLDGGLGDVINTGRMYAKNAGDDATAAGGKIDVAGQNVTASPESIITAAGGEQGGNGGSVKIDSEYTTIVQGQVDVTAPSANAKGGKVQLLGERVGLFDGAMVDASGGAGGGTVLVGGDYLGGQTPRADLKDLAKQEAEPVKNAKVTVMADTADIKADATVNGDGGKIILWSDEYTGFYGDLFARGGAEGGNGGFIETSSRVNLQAMGSVLTSSASGNGGIWLLDPLNVTIADPGAVPVPPSNIFTPTAINSQVTVASVNLALNNGGAGGTVTITTNGSATNASGDPVDEDGDITVAAAVTDGGAGGNLILVADNNIEISGTINITGDLTMTLPGDLTVGAAVNAGAIVMNDPAGAITLSAQVTTTGDMQFLLGGDFSLNALNPLTSTAGRITVNSTGGLMTLLSNVSAFDNLSLTSGGNFAADGTLNGASVFALANAGNLTFNDTVTTTTGTVTLRATAGDININDNITSGNGQAITVTADAGNVRVAAGATLSSLDNIGNVTVTGQSGVNLAGILQSFGGEILVTSQAGAISRDGAGTNRIQVGTGGLELSGNTGINAAIDLGSRVVPNVRAYADAGAITIDSIGGPLIINADAQNNINITADDNLTVTRLDNRNFDGADISLNTSANNGDILLGDNNIVATGTFTASPNGTGLIRFATARVGDEVTAPSQFYNGPVVVEVNTQISGNTEFGFNGTLELEAPLLVTSDGAVNLNGIVTLGAVAGLAGNLTFGGNTNVTFNADVEGNVVAGSGPGGLAFIDGDNQTGVVRLNAYAGTVADPIAFFIKEGGTVEFAAGGGLATSAINLIPGGRLVLLNTILSLASDTLLAFGGDLTLSAAIDSFNDNDAIGFRLETPGQIILNGAIGGVFALRTLQFDTSGGDGDILINAPVNVRPMEIDPNTNLPYAADNGTIELEAGANLVIEANLTSNNFNTTVGDISLSAGRGPNATALNNIQVGAVTMLTRGGTITFGTAAGNANGNVFFVPATTSTLNTFADNAAGDITFHGTVDGNSRAATPPLTINAGTGAVTFNRGVGQTEPFDLNIQSAGGVTFDALAPVLLGSGATTINSLAGNVSFGSTLNKLGGAFTMILGTRTTTFNGAVGGTSPFDMTISSAGGVTFTGATLLGGGATSITSRSGNVSFGNTLNKLGGTFTVDLGTQAATFTGEVGGTNPFGMTVSSAGGVTFSQAVRMGGAFTFNQLSGPFLASSSISGAFGLTINPVSSGATLTFQEVGTKIVGGVETLVPVASLTIGNGNSAIFLNGNITTSGGVINFGSPVTANESIVLNTTARGAVGGGISFLNTLKADTDVGLENLTITAGRGGLTFGDVISGFDEFIVNSAGSMDFSSNGSVSAGVITLNTDVTAQANVVLNTTRGDLIILGGLSARPSNSSGAGAIATLNSFGAISIDGLVNVSGRSGTFVIFSPDGSSSTTVGTVGFRGGEVNFIAASGISIGSLNASGGNNFVTGGDGGDGGTIKLTSGGQIQTSSIQANGGRNGGSGGKGGTIELIRSAATGDFTVSTISAVGGDGDDIGGDGGNITLTASLGDLQAPISYLNQGGEATTGNADTIDLFSGDGGTVSLNATLGSVYFQAQTLTLQGNSSLTISAGTSVVLATDLTNQTGGVVITANEGALKDVPRGSIAVKYGSGQFYMPSSAYLVTQGGDAKVYSTTVGAGKITISGMNTSGTDVNGGSINIHQETGSVLSEVEVKGALETGGATPVLPRYGRQGGSVKISGTAVSVNQIDTRGSASLATATAPAFGGAGGDVSITGTTITITSGTSSTGTAVSIDTSGGTGLGVSNATGGAGGSISLNGSVVLNSGDSTRTTVILNTQGGAFTGGASNGVGGNIGVTGTLTGTKTTSNILDLRYGSGTVTLGNGLPTPAADAITLGTLITAADDARSTGSLIINGELDLGTLTTYARGYSLSVLGGGTIENRVTFLNTGTVRIGANGVTTTFTDGFDTLSGSGTLAPSSLELGGTIKTVTATTGSMLAGTTLLIADTTLNSAGNIIQIGSLDGLFGLTLAAGVAGGNTTFSGAIGDTAQVGQITVATGVTGLVNFASTVEATGIQSAATSQLTFNNDVTLSGTGGATTDLGGTLTLNNQAYIDGDLTATLSFLGAGAKTFSGTTTFTGGPIEFGGLGDYTVTGTMNGAQNLTLSGLGTKTFTGILGGTTALGTGTGAAISMSGGNVLFGRLTTASGIVSSAKVTLGGVTTLAAGDTESSLTGDVDLLGATLTSAGTIGLGNSAADSVKLGGAVLINGTGAVNIGGTVTDNAGFTSFTQAGTAGKISFDENVTLDVAAGLVTLNGNVGLSGMSLSTAGTVTMGSALTNLITLTSGAVTLTGAGTFAVNGVIVGGGQDLTLSGAGGKTFAGALSGLGAIALTSGNGTFNSTVSGVAYNQSGGVAVLNGNGRFTGASFFGGTRTTLNGITFSSGTTAVTGILNSTGKTTMTGGLITLNTASAVNSNSGLLTMGSAVSLGQATTLSGAGAYKLSGTVNGANSLTLNGAGAKTFSGAVGTGTALSAITQNDASGLVTFAENVTMSGDGDFNANLVLDGLTMTGSTLRFGNTLADTAVISGTTRVTAGTDINLNSATTLNADLILNDAVSGAGTTTLSGTVTGKSSSLTVTTDNLIVGNTVQTGSGVVSLVKKDGGNLIMGGTTGFLDAVEISKISTSGGLTVATGGDIRIDQLEKDDTDQITGAFRMVTTGGDIDFAESVQLNVFSGSAIAGALTANGSTLTDRLTTQSFRDLTLGQGGLEYDGATSMTLSGVQVNGDVLVSSVDSMVVNGSVTSVSGDIGLGSVSSSLRVSGAVTGRDVGLAAASNLNMAGTVTAARDVGLVAAGDVTVSSRITGPNSIGVDAGGYFINSFAGNPFQSADTRIATTDLFGATWPSNGAVPGLQVRYDGQGGANTINVSTTLLAGNGGPFILEFTTGTGQPYIFAQQAAIPPVMLPAALTGGNGFARSVTYSADEIEMMTPEERSAYENQQRQVSARVILPGQSGVGEEIGAPTEGRTPQAATPAALAPVAPTAQVLLEGKPLAGAKSDKECGDATKIIKLRPTRAVALRPSYRAADVMESERMAAEVSVGAAPVAQSR